ncbi:uncharacterized protein LOC128957369 [Oppia nitens]|uniref:uncharacterized protein LOC128957369 n=1 Tax=Oppia nitens TaxID=1686743 RepID=UPI0023D99870|nr:uncharacterized protein LOC128957369 [Oppia nitens]
MDKETKRWHYFGQPFVARYVRFNVLTWRTRIAMRVGVIGCLFDGQCPDGFFRVNNYSECVPNLAYHRSTWINDKRHSWTHWEFGNSNYAVDGISGNSGGADTSADDYDQQHQQQSTTMQKCALLDNYFVETPVWMVDLAETVPIHGVVIVSWPHHYIDNNIERLTIAYDKSAKFITTTTTTAGGGGGGAVNQTLSATGIGGGGGGGGHHSLKTCARIGADQLRRSSRIHVTCDTHAVARYVYIIGFGVDKHSRHLFSAILCEVYVY